jgi:sugar (pentulose or hexulose) kinase
MQENPTESIWSSVARSLLAGVDTGTTSVKALLLTPEGEELAVGRAPTLWTPAAFGEETTGGHLLEVALAALADALRQCPGDRVIAIGVAGMGESGILADGADTPLAPVIAWHDHRDESQLRALREDIGGTTFSRRTGLPLWTQWSLTKHRWLREHVPATASARRRYSVAEWIVRGLGGDQASELSLASRTGWLDLHTARPWTETLAWSGASESLLANLVPAGTPIGRARTGGPLAALDGAVLTVAGHDHQAAAVGLGCHAPGDEFDSCGTAEAILRTAAPGLAEDVVESLTGQGVTVGWNAARDRWCLLGATQGGLILGKVMTALGVGRDGLADLDRAAAGAADVPGAVTLGPGAGDVTVDPAAAPGDVWRAATRAVSAQAAGLSDVLSRASGARTGLVVAGGWTHSSAFMAAKAEAVGSLRRATTEEAGCRGAALLAGLAAGLYSGFTDMPTAA